MPLVSETPASVSFSCLISKSKGDSMPLFVCLRFGFLGRSRCRRTDRALRPIASDRSDTGSDPVSEAGRSFLRPRCHGSFRVGSCWVPSCVGIGQGCHPPRAYASENVFFRQRISRHQSCPTKEWTQPSCSTKKLLPLRVSVGKKNDCSTAGVVSAGKFEMVACWTVTMPLILRRDRARAASPRRSGSKAENGHTSSPQGG